jgi:hypothetical protein
MADLSNQYNLATAETCQPGATPLDMKGMLPKNCRLYPGIPSTLILPLGKPETLADMLVKAFQRKPIDAERIKILLREAPQEDTPSSDYVILWPWDIPSCVVGGINKIVNSYFKSNKFDEVHDFWDLFAHHLRLSGKVMIAINNNLEMNPEIIESFKESAKGRRTIWTYEQEFNVGGLDPHLFNPSPPPPACAAGAVLKDNACR